MNKKQRRILGIIIVGITIGASCWVLTTGSTINKLSHAYEAKSSIANQLKIDAQLTKITPGKHIQFFVQLETYQNPDILTVDPLTICLLQDENQTPYKPTSWDNEKHTDHTISGTIHFPCPPTLKKATLSIFEREERTFEWAIKR